MITKKASLVLIFFGVFYATIACGDTYKCRDANNKLVYTDSPCTTGSKTEKVIPFTANSAITTVADTAVERWNKIKKARSQQQAIQQQQQQIMQEQEELQRQSIQAQQQQPVAQQQQPVAQQQQPNTLQQQLQEAQQRQQQAIVQAQQQRQNEMQGYRQQQQQESQRLGQELNAYMQSPSVTKAIEGAGTSGASMQNLLINNRINQLNQTAKGGVSIQKK